MTRIVPSIFRNRAALTASLSIAAVCAFLLTLPSRASADVETPAGCDTRALFSSWNQNCWLGQDDTQYDRHGNYTKGVQEILFYSFFQPISIDGNFGSQTTARMEEFQFAHGLSADGVVGTNTWAALRNKLVLDFDDGSTWRYYNAADSSDFRNFVWKYGATNQPWSVLNLAGTSYTAFGKNGPN
jgi:Putative peptidoglycan binding domain